MAFTLAQLNALGANTVQNVKKNPAPKRRDAYDEAIAKRQAFIDAQVKDWGDVWDRTYQQESDQLYQQLNNLSDKYVMAQGEMARKIREQKQGDAVVLGKLRSDEEYAAMFSGPVLAAKQAMDEVATAYKTKGKERSNARNAAYQERFDPLYKTLEKAGQVAEQLREQKRKQSEFDAAYYNASEAYKNAVTQHDKDRAAYEMYKAKKAMSDQDSANRQADIDAGRYAVNPYQFMAQGAGINEIEELRKQVNAGNLRPNMRVPDAIVAPEEVKDPGGFDSTQPVHQHADAPEVDAEIGDILGYTPPKDAPPPDAALPDISTEDIDTSSVTSGYQSPAEKEKKPEPEKDASGNPVVAGAGTLQQTSQGTTSPTQQTATQAATPAPALPAQPTGSVAGQGSNTGQAPETQTPPKTEEKPAPFIADEEEKDKQDSVF